MNQTIAGLAVLLTSTALGHVGVRTVAREFAPVRTALHRVQNELPTDPHQTSGQNGDLNVAVLPKAIVQRGGDTSLELEATVLHAKGADFQYTVELIRDWELFSAETSDVARLDAPVPGDDTATKGTTFAFASPPGLPAGDYCLRLTVVALADDGKTSTKLSTQCFSLEGSDLQLLTSVEYSQRNFTMSVTATEPVVPEKE